jgi:glycosyltransferase involved in cell wall biosynthesis
VRAIRRISKARHVVGVLAHYLPSLVREGALVERAQLSQGERYAIDASDAFIVTSLFMRQTLERLAESPRHFLVIEPGCFSRRCTRVARPGSELSAILVANLLPGKGIELFLRELADQVSSHDHFELRIIGSKDLDLPYALACERLVSEHPKLSQCVVLCGARHPSDVVKEISLSSLVVSASIMETYGMALAEARTIGVPILARAGGNVGAHVDVRSGGELVGTHGELARAFLELSRNPSALKARVHAARQLASPSRSWFDAARDFVAQAPLLAEVRLSQVQ